MKRFILSFLVVSFLLLAACTAPAITQTVTVTTITTPTATPTLTVTSTTTLAVTVTTTPTDTTTPPVTTTPTVTITTPPTTTPQTTTPPITTLPTTTPPTTTPPPTTVVDLSDTALIGSRNGLNIMGEDEISVLSGGLGRIEDIIIDEQGWVWALRSGSLNVFDGLNWTSYQPPEGVYTLYAIAIDSAGRVWIGYYGGVSVLDGGQWLSYSSEEFGLGDYAGLINDLAIDHQDRVWVATASGVAILDGDSWTPYDETSGLTDDSIKAIVVDHQGKIWIAHSYGVDVFNGSSWIFYGEKYDEDPQIEVEALEWVQALAVDYQGRIWAGTSRDGISVFDGSDWTTYDSKAYFCGGSVNSIACDSQGRVWLGTNFGLVVFDGSNWFHYTQNTSELLSNDIDVIIITGSGPSSLPQASALELGAVTGKVLSSGKPLAGALVEVCWEAHLLYSGESPCEGESYSATADENGVFLITNIPPNRYDLAIRTPEGDWYILMADVRVIDGETTSLGELDI